MEKEVVVWQADRFHLHWYPFVRKALQAKRVKKKKEEERSGRGKKRKEEERRAEEEENFHGEESKSQR